MLIAGAVPICFVTIIPHRWRRSVDHIDRRYLPTFDIKSGVHDGDELLILVTGLAQANTLAMLAIGKLSLPVVTNLQCLPEGLCCLGVDVSVNALGHSNAEVSRPRPKGTGWQG